MIIREKNSQNQLRLSLILLGVVIIIYLLTCSISFADETDSLTVSAPEASAEENVDKIIEPADGNSIQISPDEPFEATLPDVEYDTAEVTGVIKDGDFSDLNIYNPEDNTDGLSLSDSPSTPYDALINGLLNCDDAIPLESYYLSVSETIDLFSQILNYEPSFFYVESSFSYGYRPYTSGSETVNVVTCLYPRYSSTDKTVLSRQKAEYENDLQTIVSKVDKNMSDLEIALFIHDYIVSHFEYDTRNVSNDDLYRDVYNFFKTGKGVCQAYALSYTALLKECGVNVSYAYSKQSNHIWNVVKIDGKWYHVDCTHDDPMPDTIGGAYHDFFLRSSQAIDDGNHIDFESEYLDPYEKSDTRFDNAYWRDTTLPILTYKGKWYNMSEYIDASNGKIKTGIFCSGSGEKKGQLFSNIDLTGDEFTWFVWNNDRQYWTSVYSGFGIHSGSIYYNSPKSIMSYNISTGEKSVVCTPVTSKGYIYGFEIKDEILRYVLAKGPSGSTDYELGISTGTYGLKALPEKIEILSEPYITSYAVGDALNPEGLVIRVKYDDGSEVVTSNANYLYDFKKLGETIVTVGYDGLYDRNATFKVSIEEPVIQIDNINSDVSLTLFSSDNNKGEVQIVVPEKSNNENSSSDNQTKSILLGVYDEHGRLCSFVYVDLSALAPGSVTLSKLSGMYSGRTLKVLPIGDGISPSSEMQSILL